MFNEATHVITQSIYLHSTLIKVEWGKSVMNHEEEDPNYIVKEK